MTTPGAAAAAAAAAFDWCVIDLIIVVKAVDRQFRMGSRKVSGFN